MTGDNFPVIRHTPVYIPDYFFSRKTNQKKYTVMKIVAFAASLLIVILFVWAMAGAEPTLLSVAQLQIGLGEIGGNNRGIHVRQYLNGKEGLPWCAGFISYCLRKSGTEAPYFLRAKSFVDYGRCLAIAELKPGDLVIFDRKGGGHIGIIEKLNKNGFISIEGNVGKYPAKVKRVGHGYFEESICRFVRVR